jgi:hypothetical protein
MPDLGNWGQYGALRDDVPYGQHIALHCVNHPELSWSTKNIAPIGARSIFFHGEPGQSECSCPCSDLRVTLPKQE